MERIEVPLSKKKMIMLLLGSLGFVFVSFLLFGISGEQTPHNRVYLQAISMIGIGFFGFCSAYILRKLFDKTPGLIITDEGITDNSSALSIGFVSWTNIRNISKIELYGQEIVTIEVNNAEEIIARESGYRKLLMGINNNYYKSPIQISSNALECNFQELYATLIERFSAHKGE